MTRVSKNTRSTSSFVGYFPRFVMKSDGDLGFKEFPFLLCGCHTLSVPKLIALVKFWHFDFGMGFGTVSQLCNGVQNRER